MMPAIPFVVGQWVRGDRFYGRAAQIDEILDGHRNTIWLVGTRRIGKTSLLKQIEHITATSDNQRYFPVFWDFQGADAPEELHLNFADALLDADERLASIGVGLKDVEADDLFVSLGQLRRRLRHNNLALLLLCDEAEELIKLQKKDPSLLRKLGRAMQSQENTRTVLASTIRLWELAEHKEDTSSFLHAFTPPLYIERLSDEEARSLIEQINLSPSERPKFSNKTIESIRDLCDNHPYLLQLVCKRYVETQALDEAIEQVATDRMVSYFFSVDFEMLSDEEREIIQIIGKESAVSSGVMQERLWLGSDALDGTLRRLENLGFIRSNIEHKFILANYFFRRWLQEIRDHTAPSTSPEASTSISIEDDPDSVVDEKQSVGGLIAELKRRNVVRVGLAYVAVAWVLLQLADIVFDFLQFPDWAGKLLISFIAAGLPIALVLAWVFELTAKGLQREKDIERTQAAPNQSKRTIDFIIIAILVIAVIFFALDKFL